jgi:hypothetical protein
MFPLDAGLLSWCSYLEAISFDDSTLNFIGVSSGS